MGFWVVKGLRGFGDNTVYRELVIQREGESLMDGKIVVLVGEKREGEESRGREECILARRQMTRRCVDIQ